MLNKKLAALLGATAFVALVAALPTAQAQTVAAPAPRVMVPMQAPAPSMEIDSYSGAPVADPGDDPANWSARRNVADSDRYEQLVHTSPAFRAARIQKECGSITEADLHQQCVASFNN